MDQVQNEKTAQKIRFLIVGAWNTVFGYGVFVLLDYILSRLCSVRSVAYMTAMILTNIFAILNAYIFHKTVTFRSTAKGKYLIFEFFRFASAYVLTFGFSVILLPILVEIFEITPRISAALIVLVCTVISYVMHSKFSFKKIQN